MDLVIGLIVLQVLDEAADDTESLCLPGGVRADRRGGPLHHGGGGDRRDGVSITELNEATKSVFVVANHESIRRRATT